MKIKINPEISKELKEVLAKEEKTAARVVLSDFGCSGPIFDIELDQQNNDDIFVEIEGIKFVAEDKLDPAIKTIEVIKLDNKFTVKKSACCCGN